MKPIVEQGALPRFLLLEEEEKYWNMQKELKESERGSVQTRTQKLSQQNLVFALQAQILLLEQRLEENKKISDGVVLENELKVQKISIEVERYLKDLQHTKIYAPINGLVTQVNVAEGELVEAINAKEPLMTITNHIVFKAYVDQAQINQIKVGDEAEINLVAYPGKTLTGKVIRVNPSVGDNASTQQRTSANRPYTYPVWLTVQDFDLSPGLQGFAKFSNSKKISLLPEEAIIHLSAGEGMAMVVENGEAVVKNIRLGKKFGNQRQILGGLNNNEQVILNAIEINPGDQVTIK